MDPIAICNQALGWLGAKRIVSFEDETAEARLCADNFDLVRDAVLEARAWSFALARLAPAAVGAAPAFGWSRRFLLAPEVLRVLRVDEPGGGGRLPWAVEGRYVLTDAEAVEILAVTRVEDASLWSPGFGSALATRLAAELAVPLSENRSLQADLWGLYERKLREAGALDGMQGRAVQLGPGRIARSRL